MKADRLDRQTGRISPAVLIFLAMIALALFVEEVVYHSVSELIDARYQMATMLNRSAKLLDTMKFDRLAKLSTQLKQDILRSGPTASDQSANRVNAKTVTVLASLEASRSFIPLNEQGETSRAPFLGIQLAESASGARAVELLGAHLEQVAHWYGQSAQQLRDLLLFDHSLFVDRHARLFHIDEALNDTQLEHERLLGSSVDAAIGSSISNTLFPEADTFSLHSKSDSTRILYLNFRGFGAKPAFDLDKNVGTFSSSERAMIQRIWARVKEDYSAFDVDVTTEAPTNVTGKIGAMILITNQTSDAGGYAYLNSFGRIDLQNPPAFCFQNQLANAEKPIAECISHELGHTLGLHHQSTASASYYGGSGAGETGWAPIMGVSYYKNLTQWSKGEYSGATNLEDAYVVMAKRSLLPRVDDHGDTIAKATALQKVVSNGLNNLQGSGIINSPSDVDMFSFYAGTGPISVSVAPSAYSGNLDVALQLYDASGKLLASANAENALAASLSFTSTKAGTYYLKVAGTGKGDPRTTGYSNYGSLGQYLIQATSAL